MCKVVEIKENNFTKIESYILVPIYDETLKISVPKENNNNLLRKLLTKEEVNDLINKIPIIKPLDVDNKNIETEYKNLLHSEKIEDLITIIKTSYLRNKKRVDNKRSIGQKDKDYFDKAEKYLYNEIAVVLGFDYEAAKDYVVKKVQKEINND